MKMNKKNKKICIIVTLPTWGGAQRYVYDLAISLHGFGENITVAAGQGNNRLLLDKLSRDGIKIHQFKYLVREISVFNDVMCVFEMLRFFRKNKFDILHLNSSKVGVVGSIAGKLSGIEKVIYTAHGFVFNEQLSILKKLLYIFFEWISFLFTNMVIAVSYFDANKVKSFKILPNKKMKVIHNGIDMTGLDMLPRKESQSFFENKINNNLSNKIVVGTIANLYPNKGIEYLIEAVMKLDFHRKDLLFLIIGEGPLKENLQRKVKLSNVVNSIYFTGFIEEPEKYLKAFDIYLSPSLKEGLPYAIISALFAGLPIISTDVGGCREIIENNKSGILIPPMNSDAIFKSLLELINDKKLQEYFKEESQKRISYFDLKKMVNSVLQIYYS